MKKILLSLAATAAVAAMAAPAAAQPYRGYDNHQSYASGRLSSSYVDSLEWKINSAAQNRIISRNEARQLLGELRQVQPLAYRVQTGQARAWERQRLETTVARIESAVTRYARNDRYDRRDRDGRWDNDGRDYGYRR
jgi:hypothetical protein